jgi:hypothetical protein
MRYWRAHWVGAREQDALAEKAQCLVIWSGGARVEHAAISLSMQFLAYGLKLRPGPPTGARSGKAEPRELVWSREVRDAAYSDGPPPEIPGIPWVGGSANSARLRYHSAQAVASSSAR